MDHEGKRPHMIRIIAPHFVCGITLHEGYADRCAPIVKYMYGWPLDRIEAYCYTKGWKCQLI